MAPVSLLNGSRIVQVHDDPENFVPILDAGLELSTLPQSRDVADDGVEDTHKLLPEVLKGDLLRLQVIILLLLKGELAALEEDVKYLCAGQDDASSWDVLYVVLNPDVRILLKIELGQVVLKRLGHLLNLLHVSLLGG